MRWDGGRTTGLLWSQRSDAAQAKAGNGVGGAAVELLRRCGKAKEKQAVELRARRGHGRARARVGELRPDVA